MSRRIMRVVRRHEEVLLVLVGDRVGGGIWALHCLSEAVEIKLVGVTLSVNLGHDVLVVVVTKSS